MCEMKNSLDDVNNRLDISEEKVSKFKAIEEETVECQTEKKKGILKIKIRPVSCGTSVTPICG